MGYIILICMYIFNILVVATLIIFLKHIVLYVLWKEDYKKRISKSKFDMFVFGIIEKIMRNIHK